LRIGSGAKHDTTTHLQRLTHAAQVQRAAAAAGREAHGEAVKGKAAEGARPLLPLPNPTPPPPPPQILDPSAAAKGKIKKHLKQQVRTAAAAAAAAIQI